jgi:hypothetical protein
VILYKKSLYICTQKNYQNENRADIRGYCQGGLSALTLQTIDNCIKEIQDGTEDFPRFNLSEHAGLCTAGAPLIGASIIASYATASITSSSHAEGSEGGPANWQIFLKSYHYLLSRCKDKRSTLPLAKKQEHFQ